MTTTPAPAPAQPFWKAAAAAWDRFFFRKADPTPLGVMRIVTGLLVIYIHLAYTLDLPEFFGRNAWFDKQVADQWRHETPFFPPPIGWEPIEPSVYLPPDDRGVRKVVLDWMQSLPKTKQERLDRLRYLYQLPVDVPNSIHALALARSLAVADPGERETRLQELVSPPANRAELDHKVPGYIQSLPPDQRERLRDDLRALLASLPPPDVRLPREQQPRHIILTWLIELAQEHRNKSLEFIANLPDDPAARENLLGYMERWKYDPRQLLIQGQPIWSVFFHVDEAPAIYWVHFGLIGVYVLFTLGVFTRVTAVLTFLGTLSYINRNSGVLFGMDTMQTILLFYLMVGPSGAALSVDRLVARYRALRARQRAGVSAADFRLGGPEPSVLANFVLRLVQIHFCFIYMASGLSKLKGPAWWEQTAIWYTLVNAEFCPTNWGLYNHLMHFVASNRPLFHIGMSLGVVFTLALEIGFPFLVWSRRWRPLVVTLAVMLHTGIAGFMGLTGFGLFMITLLLSYIPASTFRQRLAAAPGVWPALLLRVRTADPRQARAAALVRALDISDQVRVVDDPTADQPRLVRPDGTAEGPELLPTLARSLRLLWPLRPLLWVPGVAALGRVLLAPAVDPTAGPNRSSRPHSVAS